MVDAIEYVLKKAKGNLTLERLYEKVEKYLREKQEGFESLSDDDKCFIKNYVDSEVEKLNIYKFSDGTYRKMSKTAFKKGRVSCTRDGKFFVVGQFVYFDTQLDRYVIKEFKYPIEEKYINGAIDGDSVLVDPGDKCNNPARIDRILSRNVEYIAGEIIKVNNQFLLKPVDEKKRNMMIFLDGEQIEGQRVIVLLDNMVGNNTFTAKVVSVIGHRNEPDEEILWEAYKSGIHVEVSSETKAQVREMPNTVRDVDTIGREDLTDWEIFTIDGADTKDIDDALSCKKLPNGNYLVGVHIMDVSYYVKKGTPLDKDAYLKGNSYYLGGKVIPMLPCELSNGICSLNPNVRRLAMSCIMEVTPNGDVVKYRIRPTVIKSSLKMTYAKVNKLLKEGICDEEYAPHAEALFNLAGIAKELRKKRFDRGGVNFDRIEAKLVFDEDGKVCDIVGRTSDVAENLIEEFMILANNVVDKHITNYGLVSIHRVHDFPNQEKLVALLNLLRVLNIDYPPYKDDSPVTGQYLQRLLEIIKNYSNLSSFLTLETIKCMAKAKYSIMNTGHFGLWLQYYAHFTSPIRRYPDLTIHRILWYIHLFIDGHINDFNDNPYFDSTAFSAFEVQDLLEISKHTSRMERVADETEGNVFRMKACEYMSQFGEDDEFIGTITSISDRNILVELDNTMVEGVVRTNSLECPFVYEMERYSLVDPTSSNNFYRLGDRVRVRISKISKEDKTIEFTIVQKIKDEQTGNKGYMFCKKKS